MKSKSKTKPTKFAEPYITAAGQAQGPAFEESSAIGKQYQPRLDQASGLLGSVIGGDYLRSGPAFEQSPYLEGYIQDSNRDITDSVNGNFMNRFGSGYHTNALVDRLSDNEERLRYGDSVRRDGLMQDSYARERGYQMGAVGDQAGLAQTATSLPQLAAGNYADAVGGLFGQYNKTTQKQGAGGLLAGVAGAGLSGWASGGFKASDRRLKVDIAKLGEEPDGLGVYEYRYVTDQPDDPLRQGVMADEVAALRPWALGPERGGFKTVNYGAL